MWPKEITSLKPFTDTINLFRAHLVEAVIAVEQVNYARCGGDAVPLLGHAANKDIPCEERPFQDNRAVCPT
jgi:hypothetical protein